MNLSDITPLVLTFNEEPNIGRCLEQLRWAERVVVIDSGSTDNTIAICREFPNVQAVHRAFDNHTAQWNFGLDQISSNWVLTLDADYMITDEFIAELRALDVSESPSPARAWSVGFHYVLAGKQLRGTLYPPRLVLFERRTHRYEQDGHTQILKTSGPSGLLKSRLNHDDRKPLSRWLDSQRKYAALEADKLSREIPGSGAADHLRKMIWPAAPAAFLYTLFFKGLILDGWPGIFYALQRTYAELLLSLELLDRRIKGKSNKSNNR
ncbi:MAG: glycosyltransferase family 2 protein [Verrucomicrobiales bacterium]